MSRLIGSGFILKKDGWQVSVWKKPSDQHPTVSVKRTAIKKMEDEAATVQKSFTLAKSAVCVGEKNV